MAHYRSRGLAFIFVLSVTTFLYTKNLFKLHQKILSKPLSPFLVILFLVRTEFVHGEIWGHWTLDAIKGFDDPQGLPVSFVIHHDVDADPMAIWNQLPPSMQQLTKFAPPAACKWGHIDPCMERALKTGLATFPTAQFFVYASFDAVPVKTFRHIHRSILDNPRSRFMFFSLNWPYAPKHHQWTMLIRKHAEMLTANPRLWTDRAVCKSIVHTFPNGVKNFGAADEFCPLRALEIITRNSSAVASDHLMKNDDPLFGYPHEESLWKDINFGLIPPASQEGPDYAEWNLSVPTTYACFDRCNPIGRRAQIGLPRLFDSVRLQSLESVILGGQYWFARKFTHNCTVELPPDESGYGRRLLLHRWLAGKLFSSSAEEEPSGH